MLGGLGRHVRVMQKSPRSVNALTKQPRRQVRPSSNDRVQHKVVPICIVCGNVREEKYVFGNGAVEITDRKIDAGWPNRNVECRMCHFPPYWNLNCAVKCSLPALLHSLHHPYHTIPYYITGPRRSGPMPVQMIDRIGKETCDMPVYLAAWRILSLSSATNSVIFNRPAQGPACDREIEFPRHLHSQTLLIPAPSFTPGPCCRPQIYQTTARSLTHPWGFALR